MNTMMTRRLCNLLMASCLFFSMSLVAHAKKARIEGVININTASPEQLTLLPRIGMKTAARIIKQRQKRKFIRTSDIMKVRGIGKKTFARMRQNLTTDKPTKFKLVR